MQYPDVILFTAGGAVVIGIILKDIMSVAIGKFFNGSCDKRHCTEHDDLLILVTRVVTDVGWIKNTLMKIYKENNE